MNTPKTDLQRTVSILLFYATLFLAAFAILSVAGGILTGDSTYTKWALIACITAAACGVYLIVEFIMDVVDK